MAANKHFDSVEIVKVVSKIDNNNSEINTIGFPQKSIRDTAELIAVLCRHFYQLGWLPGSGGAMSIRQDGLIYCTPSGVQKDMLKEEDVIVMNKTGSTISGTLKSSDCLILFMLAYELRDAGCCIHSHSMNSNLITVLCGQIAAREESGSREGLIEFRITDQEMIKAIKKGSSGESLTNKDTLVVPIIENGLRESDLLASMREALIRYPLANAVLVHNHGVFVWGRDWREAKIMAESYDYLFKVKLEAAKCRLNERYAN